MTLFLPLLGGNGVSDVRAFGAKGDGVADDTAACQRAIDTATGVVWFQPGTYRVSGLRLPTTSMATIVGCGRASVLKAAGPGVDILTVGDAIAGTAAGYVQTVDGFTLDGGGYDNVNGLLVLKAQNFRASNLFVWRNTNGIYLRGETSTRVLTLSFSNCLTTANGCGVRMRTPVLPNGCFTIFGFSGHSSESDGEGFSVEGGGGERIIIQNSEIQASTVTGLRVSNAFVTLQNTWVEMAPGGPPSAILTNGACILAQQSILYKAQIDDTSSVRCENAYVNEAGQVAARSFRLGRQGDDTGWGSPIYPVGAPGKPGGAVYERGFVWVDAYGVEWTCTTPGASDAKFAALGGRIVIPITAVSLVNGQTFWYPSEDFVLTGLDVVVTEAFAPGTATWASLGIPENPTGVYQYISQQQGTAANWGRVGVMTAAQNAEPYAALTGGKRLLLEGRTIVQGPTVANRIGGYTNGTWLSGAGYVVVRGYYPEFN